MFRFLTGTRLIWGFSLILLLGTAAGIAAAQNPSATEEPGEPAADLSRGEYLVRVVASCVDCHTSEAPYSTKEDPLTIPLSGGAAFEFEPFGVVYSPNLTTLEEWTDEDIEKAIRYGVRPDGTPLLPPMPYEAYANISDEDMAAIIAYLRTLEPVENEIPEAELLDGLAREDVRQIPEMSDEAIDGPDEDAEAAARGAYLGTTLAACVMCHGSLNEDGTLNPNGPLLGEVAFYTAFGEINAPELTASTLQDWPDAAILDFISGIRADNEPIFFMPVYHYQYMTDQDKADILAWLRAQP